jgi:hypothetical protein
MSSRRRKCVWVLAAASLPAWGAGHTEDAARHGVVPTVQAVRAAEAIRVDGRLDDAGWSQAVPATEFRQRDPNEGEPASERTELRIAYGDDALYVGLRLYDSEPSKIVRRLSRRDDDTDADYVRVYLDPRLDHQTGAIFQVSAAGVQADAVLYNDSWDDSSWDAVWESAVSLDEQGWSAEMRIPFSQLRFSQGDAQTWGINAARFIQRKNETDWLELVPKKESGIASRMAHVSGLDGLRPRRALSVLPYVVARGEYVTPAAGDPFNDGSRAFGSFGADVKYGITTNLTLDATVNPDFGQVEVDPAVVNLTEFETFYDERRPFFIEGAQIFSNFGRNGSNNFWGFNRQEPNLFYSRRIGRSPQGETGGEFADRPSASTIVGAAKVTGKTGNGWSLGLLDAVTAPEHAQTATGLARERVIVEPLTNYFASRAHRDLGRAGVGMLATAVLREEGSPALRANLARRAYVAGVDGFRFLDAKKNWVVTGRVAFSRIEGEASAVTRIQEEPQHYFQRPDADQVRLDPEATSLSGWTGAANLNRQNGNFQLNAAVWATSPGLEANDLGFNSRSDRWGGHVVASFQKTEPDRFSRRRWIGLAKWYALNFDGDRQGDGINLFSNAQFRNYWFAGANASFRFRSLNDTFTRGGPSGEQPKGWGGGFWVETDSRKRATGVIEFYGESNDKGGSFQGYWLSLKVKPTSGLSVQFGPNLRTPHAVAQWVGAFEDPTATATRWTRPSSR